VLAAYVTGHGFGHATRLLEVLREVRARAPSLPVAVVGEVPAWLIRRALPDAELRPVACDVGVAQRDALEIDEAETAARCRAFDATFDARADAEAGFLRARGARAALAREAGLRFVLPDEVTSARLDALGLDCPDVVGAADAVLTKPGYGIVSDAIAAGTRLVYCDRGDFPEYDVLVREMPRWLACVHVPSADVRAGRVGDAVRAALAIPVPPPPDLGGAARAADRVLERAG
jgi:hypothetical protein